MGRSLLKSSKLFGNWDSGWNIFACLKKKFFNKQTYKHTYKCTHTDRCACIHWEYTLLTIGSPHNTSNGRGSGYAEAKSYELNSGLPCQWQKPKFLNHHLWPPGSALTEPGDWNHWQVSDSSTLMWHLS